MGIISKGHCPCGYESEFLYEGCGMMGPATSRSLVYCDHCQEIHSILSSSARPRCPKCRRKVRSAESTEQTQPTGEAPLGKGWSLLWQQPAGEPTPIQCPRCKNTTMLLARCGFWD